MRDVINERPLTDYSICGRNIKLDGSSHEFISAGTSDVESGEFPWSASIGHSDLNDGWKVWKLSLKAKLFSKNGNNYFYG